MITRGKSILSLFFSVALLWVSLTFQTGAAAPPLREQLSLNGVWAEGGQVPQYHGFLLEKGETSRAFARSVAVPAAWAGKAIKLEFGGVAHKAEVYVNGKLAATHVGGFSPFQVDVTPLARPGKSFDIKVVVFGSEALKNGAPYMEWPVGGWSGKAGIHDDVWLRAYGAVAIEDAFITTSVSDKKITVAYVVKNTDSVARSVQVHGLARRATSGAIEKEFFSPPVLIDPGEAKTFEAGSTWANPALYWPDDPVLYNLTSELIVNDRIADRETRRFGFREFTIQGRRTFWNGVPITLLGDYQVFGDQYYLDSKTLHSRANWPATIDRMKSFNIRCLRWHHNPVPQYILDVADEKGLLICDESANYARHWMKGMPKEIMARYVEHFNQVIPAWIRADRNHPSVYMWNATNEMSPDFNIAGFSVKACQAMGNAIAALDPTRPVGYDGDRSASQSMWNAHYPEGYNQQPKGSIYSWAGEKAGRFALPKNKPWGSGEVLHTRSPEKDVQLNVARNTWWLGIWTRGLRYGGWTDLRPACYWFTMKDMASPDPAVRQRSINLRNAFAPVALFDKAYDDLGIEPYVTGVKAGGKLPEVRAGEWMDRTLILYNDEFKGGQITAEALVKLGSKVVARGEKNCTVKLGEHVEFPCRVQAPAGRPGEIVSLVLRAKKDGKLRFEEPRNFRLVEGPAASPEAISSRVLFEKK